MTHEDIARDITQLVAEIIEKSEHEVWENRDKHLFEELTNPPTIEEIRASSTVQDSGDVGAGFGYVIQEFGSGTEATRVFVPVYRKSPVSGF